jgi:uracil phosphoribosyltransferase
MTGRVLAPEALVVVPILRAGLGMVQPFTDIFPDVSVGYVGLERDHTTAVARSYYCKLPPLAGRHVFVVDPMLATGGSAAQALTIVKEKGAVNPTLVCIVSSPEGVAEVEKHHPGTVIHTAALDRELNAKKYILPGLGDFGDRLYGT